MDWEGGFVMVVEGKGGKDRMVPLGKIACRWVENYAKGIRPILARKKPEAPWLFLSVRGGPMARGVLLESVKRAVRLSGLDKRVGPHTFRHTCATHMTMNRASLRHVQELLGHASVETTQVYIAVTATDLKETHRKYHPREREIGVG